MKKGKVLFISALLVVSSIMMYVLRNSGNAKLDDDLVGFFFIGFVFGVGILTFILTLIEKKIKDL